MLTIKTNSLWYRLALYGTLDGSFHFKPWQLYSTKTICQFASRCFTGLLKILGIIIVAAVLLSIVLPFPIVILHGLFTGTWWFDVIGMFNSIHESDMFGIRLIKASMFVWIAIAGITAVVAAVIGAATIWITYIAHFRKPGTSPGVIGAFFKSLKEKVCFLIKIETTT